MKTLAVLLLMSVSSGALARMCFSDNDCPVFVRPKTHCFLVKTGTDPMGAATCRIQCTESKVAPVCIRTKANTPKRCVDIRRIDWMTWQPENGCRKSISMDLATRAIRL